MRCLIIIATLVFVFESSAFATEYCFENRVLHYNSDEDSYTIDKIFPNGEQAQIGTGTVGGDSEDKTREFQGSDGTTGTLTVDGDTVIVEINPQRDGSISLTLDYVKC